MSNDPKNVIEEVNKYSAEYVPQPLNQEAMDSIKKSLGDLIELISLSSNDGRKPIDEFAKLIILNSHKKPQKVVNRLMDYHFLIEKALDKNFTQNFKLEFLNRPTKLKHRILMEASSEFLVDDAIVNEGIDKLTSKARSKLPSPQFFIHRFTDPVKAIRFHAERAIGGEYDAEFISELRKKTDDVLSLVYPHLGRNMQGMVDLVKKGEGFPGRSGVAR